MTPKYKSRTKCVLPNKEGHYDRETTSFTAWMEPGSRGLDFHPIVGPQTY
jgi:hypothetical protein